MNDVLSISLQTISDVLIYVFLPLSLWISFRICRYPDLAIEQWFVLGGVIFFVCTCNGIQFYWILLLLLIFGLLMGLVCSFLKNVLMVKPILLALCIASILYSLALCLLNLNRPQYPLLKPSEMEMLSIGAISFFLMTIVLLCVFSTAIGRKIVAAGSNFSLAKRHHLKPLLFQGIGLGISFILAMYSGGMYFYRSANASIDYAAGLLLFAIAIVMCVHYFSYRIYFWHNILLLTIITISYQSLVQLLTYFGFPSIWFRAVFSTVLLLLLISLYKSKKIDMELV